MEQSKTRGSWKVVLERLWIFLTFRTIFPDISVIVCNWGSEFLHFRRQTQLKASFLSCLMNLSFNFSSSLCTTKTNLFILRNICQFNIQFPENKRPSRISICFSSCLNLANCSDLKEIHYVSVSAASFHIQLVDWSLKFSEMEISLTCHVLENTRTRTTICCTIRSSR